MSMVELRKYLCFLNSEVCSDFKRVAMKALFKLDSTTYICKEIMAVFPFLITGLFPSSNYCVYLFDCYNNITKYGDDLEQDGYIYM